MSPAPDCSYQSILSFNNWCRLPTGGRSWSGRMVPGPTLCTLVLTSEDTPRTHWWMAARRTIGEKLQKCWSFEGCPWTGSKHSRSAGPLQWAMVVGWWIVEWHEMCGQQRRIETYFTPSLAIDGGAAAGQTQPRPTVMVHTPSATPQPLKPTPIFIWFDKCILTAFVKTWTLGPERAH